MHEALIAAHNRFTSLMEKRAYKAFLESVASTVKRSDFAVAIDAIQSGKVTYLGGDTMQKLYMIELDLRQLEIVVRDAFVGGGRITAKSFGNALVVKDDLEIAFNFDPGLPDAVQWARANAAEMVQAINVGTREAIRKRIMQAMADGEAPWEVAESLKSVIGLTARDVQAVENYRSAQMAVASRTAANKAAAAYAKRLLINRATNIARTEVLKASNGGQQAYWKQGVAEKHLDPNAMEREWIATVPSERTCSICGRMDGQRAPIDGSFTVGGAPLEFPPAHPRCRCTTGLVFVNDPLTKSTQEKSSMPTRTIGDDLIRKYLVSKYNENHDKLGRFASASGHAAAEGAKSTDSPSALFRAAGIKSIGGAGDIDEYPTKAKAKKECETWVDYTPVSIMGGDGKVRHFAARLSKEDKAKVEAETEFKPANKPVPFDKNTPVRDGFVRATDTDTIHAANKGHNLARPIPPAWIDVQISKEPGGVRQARGGMLVATGKELIKGGAKAGQYKTQYIYSNEHMAAAAESKFARVARLNKVVKKLDARLAKDATKDPVAGAVLLMRKMGMRVGGDQQAGQHSAYGATNMLVKHAKVSADGKSVTFDFTGKHGVSQRHVTRDPEIVATVRAHSKGKGANDRLFGDNTKAGKVDRNSTDKYVDSILGGYKNHDLRTAYATALAHKLVSTMPPPKNAAQRKAATKKVSEEVSSHLGNNPSEALKSYIAPEVFTPWA